MFDDFLGALNPSDFEEVPVDTETFLYDPEYMGKYMNGAKLSPIQLNIVERGSQIFKHETLKQIHSPERAKELWEDTVRNLFLILGKGCHAPYTETYDAETGKWVRIDSLKDSLEGHTVGLSGEPEFRTESFYEGTGEMLRVTTELGFVEDVYVGHKYWGMKRPRFYKRNERGYEPEDIQADQLRAGDRIAVGLNLPVVNEISIGNDVAWVLGIWLGDGCMPGQVYSASEHNGLSVDFGGDEPESLQKYLDIVRSWGDDPTVARHEDKNMVTVKHGVTNSPKCFDLAKHHGLRGKNRFTKEIPDVVWSLPQEELCLFIAGMWQSDGSVYLKKSETDARSRWIAEWSSVSKEMAYGFQKILLRAGIPASIRSKIPTYSYKGEKKKGSKAYVLTVSGQDRLGEFNSKIELTDYKRGNQLTAIERAKTSSRPYARISGDWYFDKVKSIESIGEGDYWTYTVPQTNHYVGNGLISHNSGKDFCARLTVLYIVYKLLCLRDPQRYFGVPLGDPIDIVNLALNAPQAKSVFFDPMVRALGSSPWFEGKYYLRSNDIAFDKDVYIYSLHSSFEAAEGKNIIAVVLDEIDGFTVEGYADEMYNALSGTVSSRFPDVGKVITLSFPRTKEGFMMRMYNETVAELEVLNFEHTFVLNENIDPDAEGNSFTVTWTEDKIISYVRDNFYALKAPTFRVNPRRKIEDYKDDFDRDRRNNTQDTLMRVCANPPDHDETTFIQNHERIEEVFSNPNGWSGDEIKCRAIDGAEYYIHVDLSKVSDRTVVAMGHVSHWVEPEILARVHTESQPFIEIDLFRVWEPSRTNPVDDAEVMDFIMELCKKFNVRKVTFDQWNSFDNINYLSSVGVTAEKNSLKREEYMEFRTALYEQRLSGPYDERLWRELKNLVLTKSGKVDHPAGKEHFNDISEAVCGVVVNCIRHTFRDTEMEVLSLDSFTKEDLLDLDEDDSLPEKPEMPGYIADLLEGWRMI